MRLVMEVSELASRRLRGAWLCMSVSLIMDEGKGMGPACPQRMGFGRVRRKWR